MYIINYAFCIISCCLFVLYYCYLFCLYSLYYPGFFTFIYFFLGLNNQSHVSGVDGLAGTSQGKRNVYFLFILIVGLLLFYIYICIITVIYMYFILFMSYLFHIKFLWKIKELFCRVIIYNLFDEWFLLIFNFMY